MESGGAKFGFQVDKADGHMRLDFTEEAFSAYLQSRIAEFYERAGQNFAMKVSIVMDIAHLSIAKAVKFYRARDLPSVGWILAGWGGFFLINSKMGKGVDNPVAMWIMIAGGCQMSVIAISRQYGAGGIKIAEEVARRLGCKVTNQAVISEVARQAGVSTERVAKKEKAFGDNLLSLFNEIYSKSPAYRHIPGISSEFNKEILYSLVRMARENQLF